MTGLTGLVFGGRRGRLKKTGDTGDGAKGLTPAFTIYTTGQYSGTANVDLIHLTAVDIAFVAATKKITSVAAALAMFKTGKTIVITGSASNNGTYTIATGNVAAEIVTTEALTDEGAGASVSIAKREAISNNCVLDQVTGLMWTRYLPVVFGTGGDGLLPSTGLYGASAYVAAANASTLGGYADWRRPNRKELFDLSAWGVSAKPNAAFPVWPAGYTGTSTTSEVDDTKAYELYLNSYLAMNTIEKTSSVAVILVRG